MLKLIQNFNATLVRFLSQFDWLPPLLIRLSIGYVFFLSGQGKLLNLERTSGFFTSLHIPFPLFNAILASSVEFLGGILLILGLFTRVSSFFLAFVMLVAIATAQLSHISNLGEFVGLVEWAYFLIFIWFIFAGAGSLSLDKILGIDKKS